MEKVVEGSLLEATKEFIEKIFQIYNKDWNKIIYLSILNFLLFTAATIGLSTTTTLFLKNTGIDKLPYIYIAYAALTFVSTLIYIPFGPKISKKKF